MSTAVRCRREEPGVLRVTLDRPDRNNSLNTDVLAQLHRALDRAERDADCRVVVLEGQGGIFCSGMDFEEAASSADQTSGTGSGTDGGGGGERFLDLLERFTRTPRVIVSTVDGRATGGGVGLVAASDFVFATERSQLGLPEALWGLLPCCVLPFLIRRVGFQKAYSMTLSTRSISAQEARECQLVDEVDDDPEAALRRLVFRLNRIDPQTLGSLKRHFTTLWQLSGEQRATALGELSRLMASPLVRRNLADYVERRKFPWEA